MINLTSKDFMAKVGDFASDPKGWKYIGDKPCIVDFYAPWCRYCKNLEPLLVEMSKLYDGQLYIYKVDVDQEADLLRRILQNQNPFCDHPAAVVGEMMQLMLLLQLRIGRFCHIYNDLETSPPTQSEPPPQSSPASEGGSECGFSDDYDTTGGEGVGYHLEDHFVTVSMRWR